MRKDQSRLSLCIEGIPSLLHVRSGSIFCFIASLLTIGGIEAQQAMALEAYENKLAEWSLCQDKGDCTAANWGSCTQLAVNRKHLVAVLKAHNPNPDPQAEMNAHDVRCGNDLFACAKAIETLCTSGRCVFSPIVGKKTPKHCKLKGDQVLSRSQ